MASIAMHSLSLWMVAFTGPNSTTCGQISAMKRPSDVPPVVDSSGVTPVMMAMNEEPFGPLALVMRVASLDEAIDEGNRLPVGLGAYLFTGSMTTVHKVQNRLKSGMLGVNHFALALPETPFGGVRDSGFGSEGGLEGIEAYLSTMTVTTMMI